MSPLSLILFSFAVGISTALAWRSPNPVPALALVLVAASFILWLRTPSGTRWRETVLADIPDTAASSLLLTLVWFVAGLLLLAASFVLLEWQQPYYFTQDDALVCELPTMLVGCRAVWQGTWPGYNPYAFMGAPLTSLGLYSLTYPPTYLAYAIARHLLADEFATLEVFAVLHLLAGYAVTFGLVRQLRASSAVAAIVAISVVLSGSSLMMGRSWHTFVPLTVWLPVLAWGLVRMSQGSVGWCWTVAMGGAIGLTFHVGFPQMSLWVGSFFVVAVVTLVILDDVPLRRAYAAIPAILVGAGIALPIALLQMRAAESMGPRGVMGAGLPLPDAWVCMLVPYPLGQAVHPNDWGSSDREYMGQMYFFGGLLGVLFFANLLALFSAGVRSNPLRGQFWLLAALVTLILMQGDSGGLWGLLGRVPVVGRVNNHPFRLLPFFVLFASLAGGLVLERTLRLAARRRTSELLLGVVVGGLLLYHVSLARPSFYTYPIQPYPALPEEMNTVLGLPDHPTGRVMAWSPVRSTQPEIGFSLINAIPGAYRMPAFHGYDPLVENSPPYTVAAGRLRQEPVEAARAYGVRWHLTVQGIGPIRAANVDLYTMEEGPPYKEAAGVLKPLELPKVFESGSIVLTELDDVHPLAFVEGHPDQPLPMRFHPGGIEVEVGSAGGETAIVNFLWRAEMVALVDGAPVPCPHDEWLRIRVPIPAGSQRLELRYAPDWTPGLLLGCVTVLLGVGLRLGCGLCKNSA